MSSLIGFVKIIRTSLEVGVDRVVRSDVCDGKAGYSTPV